jgi:hypothetical protein
MNDHEYHSNKKKRVKLKLNFFNKKSNLIKMKYAIIILFALAVYQADAFISSLINNVTGFISGVQLAGQFLWENAVAPALTTLQESIKN